MERPNCCGNIADPIQKDDRSGRGEKPKYCESLGKLEILPTSKAVGNNGLCQEYSSMNLIQRTSGGS